MRKSRKLQSMWTFRNFPARGSGTSGQLVGRQRQWIERIDNLATILASLGGLCENYALRGGAPSRCLHW